MARSLRAPVPPNTVYIYQPTAGKEGGASAPSSASPCTESVPALLCPLKPLSQRNPLQKVTIRCKFSTKRKVTPPPATPTRALTMTASV